MVSVSDLANAVGYFAFGCVSMLVAMRLFAPAAAPSPAAAAPKAATPPVAHTAVAAAAAAVTAHRADAAAAAASKAAATAPAPSVAPPAVEHDSDDDDDDQLIAESAAAGQASVLPSEHKMVLVVRNDLGMGKGKIGAQCGHATLGAYKRAVKKTPAAVASWSRWGQAKICVKVNSEAELLEIEQLAAALGIPHYTVADAGRTQIEAGSLTVLAVGPAPVAQINEVTGHLKLL